MSMTFDILISNLLKYIKPLSLYKRKLSNITLGVFFFFDGFHVYLELLVYLFDF